MTRLTHEIASLARRAGDGDGVARQEFKQRLETALVHIVRWTLQSGSCPSALSRHILAEARRMAPTADFAETWQSLSGPVAQRVCAGILANVSTAVPRHESLRDTMRN